jgi:glycerol kinase
LAGLAVGMWDSPDVLASAWRAGAVYEPAMSRDQAGEMIAGWRAAVARARSQVAIRTPGS